MTPLLDADCAESDDAGVDGGAADVDESGLRSWSAAAAVSDGGVASAASGGVGGAGDGGGDVGASDLVQGWCETMSLHRCPCASCDSAAS